MVYMMDIKLCCSILLFASVSVAMATLDQQLTYDENLASNPLIQQLLERVDMLERQGVKQTIEIETLKEMSQQAGEIQSQTAEMSQHASKQLSVKAEMSHQASEIQSLKAEMAQQANEIQSLRAEMSQQANELQFLKAEMSQQACEIQSLKAEISQQASQIQSLKADISQQANEIQSMKAEMSQQASEIQSMKAEISQQASQIQSLKAEMSQQASEIQSLKAEMSQQASEIQSLKAEMSQQASEIQSLKVEMSHQRTYVNRIRSRFYNKNMLIQRLLSGASKPTKGEDLPGSEIVEHVSSVSTIIPEGKQQTQDIRDTVKRIVPVENVPVAFSASLTHYTVIDVNVGLDNIVFDYVETNVGNAYNSSSGDFIAPVSGIYVFSTTLLSDNSTYTPYLAYTVNRQQKSLLDMSAHQREMVSKTVVFQLNKGDRVAILGAYVRLIDAGIYNVFSGFLLHQMSPSTLLTPVVG